MALLKDVITDVKVDSLHTTVETSGQKYLCYTRLSADSWNICVSDGYDIWRREVDLNELDTLRDLAEINSIDAYLTRFRSAFTGDDVQVAQQGMKICLTVGVGSKALRFELYEPPAAEKKTEMHTILFRLAENLTDKSRRLDSVSQQLETLKQQRATSAASSGLGGGLFDLDANKKKGQPKGQPKGAGMSILNPGSKKRKAAGGVVFD